MHIHYLFSIFALFFSWGQCYLQYVPRTDKCVQSSPAIGNSEFCCSAFCIDGTIAGRPGQCLNYTDPCKDVDGPPSCGAGRTYAGVKRDWVDVGGVCPFTRACPSQKFSWTWTCCDCPAGYVSFNHGACVLYPSLYSCVGCTDPKELLTGDAVNGFKCILRLSSSTTSKSSTRTSSQSSTRTTMTSSTRAPTCTTAAGKNPFDCWSCNKSQYDACPNTVNYKCTAGVNKGFTTKCPKTCLDVSVAIPSTCKTIPQRPSCYVSQAGIDFLKKEEMFCSTFYNQGDNVKTIGWGHNCNALGNCASIKLPLDKCVGEKVLRTDIDYFLSRIGKLPNVERLTQSQLDALLSLAYNCGEGKVTTGVIKGYLKNLELGKICDAIPTVCKANLDRRAREVKLCKKDKKALGCKVK